MSRIPAFFICCIKCTTGTPPSWGEVNMEVVPVANGVTILNYTCFRCGSKSTQKLDFFMNNDDRKPINRRDFRKKIKVIES